MEELMKMSWSSRCANSISLKSVTFPRCLPRTSHLFSGHTFEISNETRASTKFAQVDPFMWISQDDDENYYKSTEQWNSTIVVNWGAVAKEMSNIFQSLLIVPNTLIDIIILYASPLSAFVQADAPNASKVWNSQNNKWFLGNWSNTNYNFTFTQFLLHPELCKDSICLQLWKISNDKNRRNKLFLFIDNQGKMRDLINYTVSSFAQIGNLDFRDERVRLFELVLKTVSNLRTRHWFHENCPLDNF
jgi:hypothetical protein